MKPKYLCVESGKIFRSFTKAVDHALANNQVESIQEWIGGKCGSWTRLAVREGNRFVLDYHLLGQLPCD